MPARVSSDRKACRRCKEVFEVNEENFTRSKTYLSGFGPYCKPCDRVRKQESNERVKARDPAAFNKRAMEYQKTYKERHPDRVLAGERRRHFRKSYGLLPETYDEFSKKQGGRCALCNELPKEDERLFVDHSHADGMVRGLLCSPCNVGLGMFKEDIETLKKAISYLEKHQDE